MRRDGPVVRPEDSVDDIDPLAPELVATRHLVVLDARRRVVGILSLRDLLEVSLTRPRKPDGNRARRSMSIADLMTRPVETVGPDEVLAAAASRMLSHRIGCLPVVREDGVMIGLVTDTDLLEAAAREPCPPG